MFRIDHSFSRRFIGSALILSAVIAAASDAGAQIGYFGKNKIQYTRLDWQVMESPHFRLHFYPLEEELAQTALALAESSYAFLAVKYGHEIPEPIPLVIYSAHAYFEQTNIIPQFLPEGVGGFTDFMRSRVALPFSGSYADFRRILQHELVHAFQFSYMDRIYRLHPRGSYLIPPLWFMEGLAEYWSRSWDSDGDMILADLLLNGRLPDIPELWQLGVSFNAYKVGQSLVTFIAENYGEDKLRLLLELLWTARTFEDLLGKVCGVPVEDINRAWKEHLKRIYYPTVRSRQALEEFSHPVTAGMVDLRPAVVPGGDGKFLYLSYQLGYPGIYVGDLNGEGTDAFLKAGSSDRFESMHIFGSGVDVSSDRRVAFVTRTGGRDALYVYTLTTREEITRGRFPSLIALSSPTWSPDGERIVFSALTEDGYSDLFLWTIETGRLERLTHDRYMDQDPDWSPDGRWIAFASDRTAYGDEGHSNLFLLDLESRRILYLTAGPWNDAGPRWNPSGTQVAFSSDRHGRFDLYTIDREGEGRRLTYTQTKATDPDWVPGGGWVFSGFEENQFRIFHLKQEPESTVTVALDPPGQERVWMWPAPVLAENVDVRPYQPDFSLEVAQGGVAFGPYQTIGQGLQAALGDLLGDRLLFFLLTNTARTASDFLSRFNVGLAYVNLSGRTNWGVSGFHTSGDFLDELGSPYFKQETGAGVILSYPFSKFARVESGVTAMYGERENLGSGRSSGLMVANSLALVYDTSVWFLTGPMDGWRCRVGAGLTMNTRIVETENGFVEADLRRYFRLSPRSALAFRAIGRVAVGRNPVRSILGGPLYLRGYDWLSIYGTRSLLLNGEIRFPFVRRFVLNFPAGDLEFPGIEGVAFVDGGNAWEKDEDMPRLIGSVGVGLRMALGMFTVLRLDFSRRTDFRELEDRTYTQFFIGWNY
jgi:Tol biopolymer transport system component